MVLFVLSKTIREQLWAADIGAISELNGRGRVLRDKELGAELNLGIQSLDNVETSRGRMAITFEDDRYHASGNWHKVAEQYLKNYNYKVAARDVTTKKGQLFETWFINDNYYFETIDYIDWKGNLEWS